MLRPGGVHTTYCVWLLYVT